MNAKYQFKMQNWMYFMNALTFLKCFIYVFLINARLIWFATKMCLNAYVGDILRFSGCTYLCNLYLYLLLILITNVLAYIVHISNLIIMVILITGSRISVKYAKLLLAISCFYFKRLWNFWGFMLEFVKL